MAQVHALICFAIILAGIIGTSGHPTSANFNCTCRNNDNRTGIGDIGVTNYYISDYGGGTCYVDYDPALSTYDNSRFFNNSGGTGTGYFTHGGSYDGNNGHGDYTYHHFTNKFTGVTNFNYYLPYIFYDGTIGATCSSYCGSTRDDCYVCCKFCCGGGNTPTHPFSPDGRYDLVLTSGCD
jgi:hypothetical protein